MYLTQMVLRFMSLVIESLSNPYCSSPNSSRKSKDIERIFKHGRSSGKTRIDRISNLRPKIVPNGLMMVNPHNSMLRSPHDILIIGSATRYTYRRNRYGIIRNDTSCDNIIQRTGTPLFAILHPHSIWSSSNNMVPYTG